MPSNSCLGPNYNPNPPRAWSRVERACEYITNADGDVYVPWLDAYLPIAEAIQQLQMAKKANVLQYKSNSSSITKKQKYAQIAKGKWTSRTKAWATQTDAYTNPNIRSLQRINVERYINADSQTVPGPATCGPSSNPVYPVGGTLVATTVEDTCTGYSRVCPERSLCAPTYCSDVPGPIMNLCYNPRFQTYYTRVNRTMNNSGNKWPQGYKDFVSANSIPGV